MTDDLRLYDLLAEKPKHESIHGYGLGVLLKDAKDLFPDDLGYLVCRSLLDGKLEPLVEYLEGGNFQELPNDKPSNESFFPLVLKALVTMLKGDPDGRVGFKLVARPSTGSKGKPMTLSERVVSKKRNHDAMIALDREYGFQKQHTRNGRIYSPQLAIHAAAKESGLSEAYIRKNLKRLKALRDTRIAEELRNRAELLDIKGRNQTSNRN